MTLQILLAVGEEVGIVGQILPFSTDMWSYLQRSCHTVQLKYVISSTC